MPRLKPSVQEIRLGALYRMGARRQLGKKELVEVMTKRAGLKHLEAEQLAAHWLTSGPYRRRR